MKPSIGGDIAILDANHLCIAAPRRLSDDSLAMTSSSAPSRKALSKIAQNRLQKELVEWQANPPAGFKHKVTDNLQRWMIDVSGVPGTLYANETYQLQVDFPEHYPMEAPQVIFVPPAPLHPHIYSNGHICLDVFDCLHDVIPVFGDWYDILYDSWSPAMTVSSICISIVSMLSSSPAKQRPADNDRYVRNCKNGRSPKETRWWFHDDKV
ncbi:Ubiquitin-conjugating enzyme 15-like protein [Drosera capensis]